ncbi:hypothetical protein ROR02_27410 [Pararhodospirillum oryzae]|uniref:PD-(D/E)XK nuclease-like domain-containing protein n=1 Tax=Pararhodospirillum oryzae TaxID=478448 RepID=A0A512HB50_9PROT|nr:hypothetical protein ROR02_27410 [Pararhodospirillum oryzae]
MQELGSRLSRQDAEAGANFISEDIYRLARREAAYREHGALYDTERLCRNLLSSQALCFNLFGLLRQDLDLASRVVERLMPGVYRRVTGVLFEHSPGRNNPLFTGDNTAFDAFLLTETDDQLPGFVAVEVKYTESFEDTGSGTGPRHDELSEASGLYGDHHADALRKPPLQQLWREHLLAYATLTKRPFSSGGVRHGSVRHRSARPGRYQAGNTGSRRHSLLASGALKTRGDRIQLPTPPESGKALDRAGPWHKYGSDVKKDPKLHKLTGQSP